MDTTIHFSTGGRTLCDRQNWCRSDDWSDETKLYHPRSGQGWVRLDGRQVVLLPGHLYLLPPHRAYSYGTEEQLEVDWLHFSALSPVFDLQLTAIDRVVVFGRDVTFSWRTTCELIADFFSRPRPSLLCQMQALALDLIGQALTDVPPLAARYERLLPAIRFMEDHVTAPPALAAIAQQVHLSPEHLHRLFRQALRTTPFEYLQGRRLLRAYRLLIDGTLSVKQVAAACGYDDPYYFSRVFRQRYGCPPRAVRQGRSPTRP